MRQRPAKHEVGGGILTLVEAPLCVPELKKISI